MKDFIIAVIAFISSLFSFGSAHAENVIPGVSACLEISAIVQCNEAGSALISECGGVDENLFAVFPGRTPAEGIDAEVVLGDGLARALNPKNQGRVVSECSEPVGSGVFICPFDSDVRANARLYLNQIGFFRRMHPESDRCTAGTLIVF